MEELIVVQAENVDCVIHLDNEAGQKIWTKSEAVREAQLLTKHDGVIRHVYKRVAITVPQEPITVWIERSLLSERGDK
jgi:hypothetical protein